LQTRDGGTSRALCCSVTTLNSARVGGELACGAAAPDEATLRVHGSKTDQLNVGTVRTHHATEDPLGLCPVRALAEMRREFPERFHGGSEASLPLFRWPDGSMLKRSEIQSWLRRAGAACGTPPDLLGSHSLRIGGACALYHAGHDTELIKRWGRWASAAFHVYLWETAEQSKGVAKTMVNAPGTLIAARGLGSVELARVPRYEARRRRAVATATA